MSVGGPKGVRRRERKRWQNRKKRKWREVEITEGCKESEAMEKGDNQGKNRIQETGGKRE